MASAVIFPHEPELERELRRIAVHKHLTSGTVLLRPGDAVTHVPVVLEGALRVLLQNADGAERYLYHVHPGESCALSLICCRGWMDSQVKAVAEEDTEVLLIATADMEALMKHAAWSRYMGQMQAQRFGELLEALELIAFSRLDEQLWSYLVKRVQASGSRTLKITHQAIAQELASPREVITRLLHQLQQRGRVVLGRNTVQVDPTAG